MLSILLMTTLVLNGQFHFLVLDVHATTLDRSTDKVVILNFDDNHESQFTQAKPILDKYGFKATFYVVCNYLDNKRGYMDWVQLETLHKEGHDIGSHTMKHANLSRLSMDELRDEVGQSKQCLKEHGINPTSFAYPYNKGSDNKTVVKMVSKYYQLSRTASDPLTFLDCTGWIGKSDQTDCRTFGQDGKLNYANRYSIQGWSHDLSRKVNSYDNDMLFDEFVRVVNSQSEYNKNGAIKAITIIIYHRAGDVGLGYNTDLDLFEKEMKYLHDNNFKIITMSDLGYDEKSDLLYVK